MTEAPFAVEWTPIVAIVETSDGINNSLLRDTLVAKAGVRVRSLGDIYLRLDPASELAVAVKPGFDAHAATGGSVDTFR